MSPEFVVTSEVRSPYQNRLGVPPWSHVSTPSIVVAGMFVIDTADELLACRWPLE